jgi:hypothetical protein
MEYSILMFVDSQKAFDTVDRNKLWVILEVYAVKGKILNLIKELYKDSTLSVVHFCKKSNPIFSTMGDTDGCILSPTLFAVLMDFIMSLRVENKNRGIRWGFARHKEVFSSWTCLSLIKIF